MSGACLNTVFLFFGLVYNRFSLGEGLTLLFGNEKGIRCVLYSVISFSCCINDSVWTHWVSL